jgi:aspartyl-tRNA(Asn)/glutamyl-tRNA(Gln) amidotransferase subunit B
MQDNENLVEEYRSGRKNLIGFFVGQVMRASGGVANPCVVNDMVRRKLEANH